LIEQRMLPEIRRSNAVTREYAQMAMKMFGGGTQTVARDRIERDGSASDAESDRHSGAGTGTFYPF